MPLKPSVSAHNLVKSQIPPFHQLCSVFMKLLKLNKRSKFFYATLLCVFIGTSILITKTQHTFVLFALLLFSYSVIFICGCSFIAWNFFLNAKNTLQKKETPTIALTFDDGPQPQTAIVLDILRAHDIKASFFVIGKNVNKHPDIARRIQAEGHTLGNHSMSHSHWANAKLTGGTIKEITDCNATIEHHTGITPTLFRPPHGVTTQHLGWALKCTRMNCIGWSIRSFDTVSRNEHNLLHRLKKQLNDGAIILLHDFCPITATVLPEFIVYAKKQGFKFTSL